MRRAALITILILASCAGDGQTTEAPQPAPTLTTLAPASVASSSPPLTTLITTTTTVATTTQPPANAAPDYGLSQVVFGEGAFVVITNWGNGVGSLSGYWLSQGDLLHPLPDVELSPGEQALIGLAEVVAPDLVGIAEVIDLGSVIGPLALDSGEIALHKTDQLDDPASLVAYVEWGDGAHQRAPMAIAAGIWQTGAVAVFDDAPSISSGIHPALSSADWSVDLGG